MARLVAWIGIALAGAGCSGPEPPPNLLVLVTADTLRADRLGAYGSTLGLSPNLDALAERSLVFEIAYAPTSFTLPSISALLTGRYPEEIGIAGNRSALRATVPTLASVLREHGWWTAAVVSNLVLRRESGLAAGFDHYDDEMQQREAVRKWPERIARQTTDAFLAALDTWLQSDGDGAPGFFWVHYQDPHGPYTPPGDARARYLERERNEPDGRRHLPKRAGRGGHGTLPSYQSIDGQREVAFYRAGYDGEVAYLDEEVGRLLAGLDARGLLGRAIIGFTADHGEALGEDDYWFAHGDRLTDPLVRVPLMLEIPGVEAARRSDVVSLVDVLPTLLGVAAIPSPPSRGRDLLDAEGRRVPSQPYLATLGAGTTTSYGIVDGAHKLVLTQRGGDWEAQLYRRDAGGVEKPADDLETRRRLHRNLEAFRAAMPRGEVEQRQHLSPTQHEQLEALGYLEDVERDPG